jgi:hypothetical protein
MHADLQMESVKEEIIWVTQAQFGKITEVSLK